MTKDKIINTNFSHRRIFISKDKEYYQLFSFEQHKDGSIYCSLPEFSKTRWSTFKIESNKLTKISIESLESGKFSMHGSGVCSFTLYSDPKNHQLRVKGFPLVNFAEKQMGIRHLFTAFLKEPSVLPISPALNRESDYLISSNIELKPFVIIFFAVPCGININLNYSFNIDDLDNIPPHGGFGEFGLRHHHLVWIAYQTKCMDDWPSMNHICYFDGSNTPIFIGREKHLFNLEMRNTFYSIKENELVVKF